MKILRRSVLPPRRPPRDLSRLEEPIAVVSMLAVLVIPAVVYFVERWQEASRDADQQIERLRLETESITAKGTR